MLKLSQIAALTFVVGSCITCVGAQQKGASHAQANTIFSTPLQDVPGKQLVVVSLEFKPKGSQPPFPHRHPGSVYVYVTRGTARLGLEGQPVQEVHAGGSFFEPPGAVHAVRKSASETESAEAIAVLIVPPGAPLLTAEPHK